MKNRLFRWLGLILPVSVLFAFPLSSLAETFTGMLNGHECAHKGESCPIGRLDPHISLESDFVLMLDDGDYVFLPNLNRDVKVRHVLETVQIEGRKNSSYNTIHVDVLRVLKGDRFVTVWTQKQADFEYQSLYRDGLAWPGQQVENMNRHNGIGR